MFGGSLVRKSPGFGASLGQKKAAGFGRLFVCPYFQDTNFGRNFRQIGGQNPPERDWSLGGLAGDIREDI